MSEAQHISAYVIMKVPTLSEVVQAEGRSLTLRVGWLHASAVNDADRFEASCEVVEFKLEDVGNIKLDSDERTFSFRGKRHSSYEHSYGNRASTRTETTEYEVVVRWRYRLDEGGAWAYLMRL